METASRMPAQHTFDKHSAAVNESQAAPPNVAPTSDAPGYLQQARETLASMAGTVQNAVGIETPSSTLHGLAENTKIKASMPSSEKTGAAPGEHVGGVGALPGNASEEGVARLPAERTSMPSQEYEGAYPGEKTGGGVGALPGKFNESGVALLPDERAAEAKAGVESSAYAATHPKSEDPNRSDLKTAAAHPVEAAKQARRGSASSSSSEEGVDSTGQPRRKTTLKDKITGAVKVATGKVKKDETMVAEGQALRGH
ncbi:hypothetical protein FRC08_006991 [Ceratobasidium sp. 394]|nr:hypothetical protein FRC08_006991 [Ceratobasidium sp. 394]KAG9099602.1 hypothetical protein FS749_000854 [Ceratobasidium sp. UAMH 11750]